MSMPVEGRQQRGSRIAARVRNTNVFLLVLVLVLITITTAVMGTGITRRASEDLAFFYSVDVSSEVD